MKIISGNFHWSDRKILFTNIKLPDVHGMIEKVINSKEDSLQEEFVGENTHNVKWKYPLVIGKFHSRIAIVS